MELAGDRRQRHGLADLELVGKALRRRSARMGFLAAWTVVACGVMRSTFRLAVSGLGFGSLMAITTGTALAHGIAAPEPTPLTALTTWSPDPFPVIGALFAAGLYLLAVRRVNGTHPRVPVPYWRVAAWLAGIAAIVVALVSAVDVYAEDLLTVHMVQHLLLAMVVPPLLALGAPVTLLLRIASPRVRHRFVLPVLHSRFVRLVASPLVAWPLFAVVMWLTHFSPLYNAALEDRNVHVAEHALYLAAGLLFWWPVVAADPIPGRMGYGGRLAYVGLQMPVNAAVGLAIYFAPTVLYPHYATIVRSWGPSALIDQQIGGVIMWGVGDLLLLAMVPALVASWMRADARQSIRSDARLSVARAAEAAEAAARAAGQVAEEPAPSG
jgi:cytochrome c oxidase assembly factor CtaG